MDLHYHRSSDGQQQAPMAHSQVPQPPPQQQQYAQHQYPGFVEPPPSYSDATALNANSAALASGSSSFSATSCATAEQWQNEQLTLNEAAQSKFDGGPSAASGGGHFQPQAPPMLPPGAVPFPPSGGPPVLAPPPQYQTHAPTGGGDGGGLSSGAGGGPSHVVKVIIAVPLGPHDVQLECSNCRQSIRTRIVRRPGLLAWLICGALALVGCWPCCVIPFCAQSCQDAEHFCPNCNSFIGKYSRI